MPSVALFNRDHVRHNRMRASASFPDFRFLHDWAEQDILERLSIIRRNFPAAAILNSRASQSFQDALSENKNVTNLITLSDQNEFILQDPSSLDLIISILDLHTINDLPGLLVQIRQILKPDGLFMAAMPGGETLYELRSSLIEADLAHSSGASPRVFPFADKQQMGGLLQRAGFSLPVVDSDILRVAYRDIFHLMQDLKGMGETNAISDRRKTLTSRTLFEKAAEIYSSNFTDKDGKITASFEIISLIGWAPHASQQQPQRRGSATARLAAVLGTEEFKSED
jgi:NADH dehydrogenase [ubiquinone] 1 alpha subcomplex assembly factor 5